MRACSVLPAYGRMYQTSREAIKAFNQNKDFILADITSRWNGKPCNKRDLIKGGYTFVEVRYGYRGEHVHGVEVD